MFDRALEAGADALIVVIGYEGDRSSTMFDDAYASAPVSYVHQRERSGLAHAVLQTEPHVDGTFFVVNGDYVFGTSLQPVVAAVDHENINGVIAL